MPFRLLLRQAEPRLLPISTAISPVIQQRIQRVRSAELANQFQA